MIIDKKLMAIVDDNDILDEELINIYKDERTEKDISYTIEISPKCLEWKNNDSFTESDAKYWTEDEFYGDKKAIIKLLNRNNIIVGLNDIFITFPEYMRQEIIALTDNPRINSWRLSKSIEPDYVISNNGERLCIKDEILKKDIENKAFFDYFMNKNKG